jgi:hypothetical protein
MEAKMSEIKTKEFQAGDPISLMGAFVLWTWFGGVKKLCLSTKMIEPKPNEPQIYKLQVQYEAKEKEMRQKKSKGGICVQ